VETAGGVYAYHFVENGEQDVLLMIKADVLTEHLAQLMKRMGKMGIVVG
jgi:hypothetical protein